MEKGGVGQRMEKRVCEFWLCGLKGFVKANNLCCVALYLIQGNITEGQINQVKFLKLFFLFEPFSGQISLFSPQSLIIFFRVNTLKKYYSTYFYFA